MDYQLFSADDHIDLHFLPADLWTARVPAAFRDRAPHVVETPDGQEWRVQDHVFGRFAKSNQRMITEFGKSGTLVHHEESRWRPTTPELRLEDMDRDGVEAQVLYGGLITGFQQKDPELNAICQRAYNEWTVEFCNSSPGRLIGLGFLPVHNVEAAVKEIRYCAKIGLRGVQFQPFDAYRQPWDEVWEPLWAASADTGVSISFHIGAGTWTTVFDDILGGPKGRGATATFVATAPNQMDELLCSLVLSGVLHRHPDFQAVLGESSIGWIPYILERMDRKYEERHIRARKDDAADLDMMPSDYWKRQGHATFQEDPIGVQLLEYMGPQTVMWASDYPHTDSVWPESHETVDKMFKDVDPRVTKMVLRENGLKLYGS